MLKLFRDKRDHPLAEVFNRYYWLQIGFIALSVVIGIACSAWVIKGFLLRTALELAAAGTQSGRRTSRHQKPVWLSLV